MDRFSVRRFVFPQRAFTVAVLPAGMAVFLYLAVAVVELITGVVVEDHVGEGRRKRAIGQLRDHTITCGFGRFARDRAVFAAGDVAGG